MRLIDGDSLYASLEELYDRFGCEPREVHFSLLDMEMNIRGEETVDAEPVRRGHWKVLDEAEPRRWGCSNCRCLSWHEFYYCPNCGAKMDEEENENETD